MSSNNSNIIKFNVATHDNYMTQNAINIFDKLQQQVDDNLLPGEILDICDRPTVECVYELLRDIAAYLDDCEVTL